MKTSKLFQEVVRAHQRHATDKIAELNYNKECCEVIKAVLYNINTLAELAIAGKVRK